MLDNRVVEKVHAFRVSVDGASKIVSALEESTGFTIVPILYSPRRYINARSIDSIYTVLRELGIVDKLAVVLFSGGGDIDEAYILATYLQDLAREKLVFYIPRYAKSAATLLALAGDEVVLLPVAELGPVDPVIYDSHTERYIPLQSILEILDLLSQKGLTSELASDGHGLYALRYANQGLEYYTLYYLERPQGPLSLNKLSETTLQLIRAKLARGEKAVLVASEPLTEENWLEIPNKHMLIVDKDLSVKLIEMP